MYMIIRASMSTLRNNPGHRFYQEPSFLVNMSQDLCVWAADAITNSTNQNMTSINMNTQYSSTVRYHDVPTIIYELLGIAFNARGSMLNPCRHLPWQEPISGACCYNRVAGQTSC